MSQQLYREKLASSGLDLHDAKRLHFQYTAEAEAARLTAQHKGQFKEPSLLIPYHDPSGKKNDFWRLRRLTKPEKKGFSKKAVEQRYTQSLESLPRAYFPPLLATSWAAILSDPTAQLYITEGELKAAAGCKILQEPVLALGGVWNWMSTKERTPLIPDLDKIEWGGRVVYLVFDSDTATNPNVKMALNALSRVLTKRGALVHLITLPAITGADGKLLKTGLDDFLVSKGAEEFFKLADTSEPFSLAGTLWDLNDHVIWVRHPTMVIEQATDELMSVQQFRDNYAPIKYTQETAEGKMKEASAAAEWIKWGHRAEVHKVVYKPGAEKVILDAGLSTYNLWPGWGVEPARGDISPWKNLLDYALHGMEKNERKWFEQWIASQFQNPGQKIYSAVLMWGPTHGTGKSLIGATLLKIFGRNGVLVEQHQLSGHYNKWAENKQFILGDEITGIEKRKEADHIKNLITRETFEVDGKYMPTYYMADVANWYLTSNHPDALILEDTDRRFFVWQFPAAPLPLEFYQHYDSWLHEDGPAHLFYHMLRVDLEGFNHKAPPPVTRAKMEMIYQGKTDLAAWVSDLKRDPDSVLQMDRCPMRGDLYTVQQLVSLAEAQGVSVYSANVLSRELTAAGFPPSQIISPFGTSVRARPVRNFEAWEMGRDWRSKWCAHWEETRAKSAGSKGGGGAKERKF